VNLNHCDSTTVAVLHHISYTTCPLHLLCGTSGHLIIALRNLGSTYDHPAKRNPLLKVDFKSHVQQLRSKQLVPILAGASPASVDPSKYVFDMESDSQSKWQSRFSIEAT